MKLILLTLVRMPLPLRIIRTTALEFDPRPRAFSPREQERHDRILQTATGVMARHGRNEITFSAFAGAMRLDRQALRFHFADLDALLADILHRHLRALSAALGNIPAGTTDRPRAWRAAWRAYTRTAFGGLTDPHLLLVRDRHLLPDDLRPGIEATLQPLVQLLAGRDRHLTPDEILAILDNPDLTPEEVEVQLATADPEPEAVAMIPEPPAAPGPPSEPEPDPPPWNPNEKPGDWVFTCGLPPPPNAATALPRLREREGPAAQRWEGEGRSTAHEPISVPPTSEPG
jgi:AcrR family transcriptional regulator